MGGFEVVTLDPHAAKLVYFRGAVKKDLLKKESLELKAHNIIEPLLVILISNTYLLRK